MARPSTVRISSLDCAGDAGVGSGVFISNSRILTAAHVVADADSIVIQSDQFRTYARVVAIDTENDFALIATDDVFTGGHLDLADYKVDQGSDVRVLGYPDAVTERWISEGIVASNAGELIDPDSGDVTASGLLAVTAPLNPGNSGGPVVDIKGSVIGIVSAKNFRTIDGRPTEGMSFAVHASDIAPTIKEWLDREPQTGTCSGAADDETDYPEVVTDGDLDSQQQALATSLMLHGGAINAGDYEGAWELFSPRMRKRMGSLEGWAAGLTTSIWDRIQIHSVTVDGTRGTAHVTLNTQQSPEYSKKQQDCSVWDNTYGFRVVDDQWLIDSSNRTKDSPTAC